MAVCLNYEVKMLRNLKALYKYTDRFLTRERQTEKYKERERDRERETNKERTVLIIKNPGISSCVLNSADVHFVQMLKTTEVCVCGGGGGGLLIG